MKKYISSFFGILVILFLSACSSPINSITISKDSLNMAIGESTVIDFSVAPNDANKNNVKIISNDKAVASVDGEGRITAIGPGNTTILFSAGKEVTASCSVTVSAKVESIVLTKNSLEIIEGETAKIGFTVLPKDASINSVVIESTDPEVVTVDENGIITAVSQGEANIVLSTESGASAIYAVTVIEKSSYERLSDAEKSFVDMFITSTSTFRNPETIEILGIDTSISKAAPYVRIRAQNAMGGYGAKIYLVLDGALIPALNNDAPIYSTFSNDESYNLDLINAAIQEKR